MAWRVANSLNVLLNQLNSLAPNRSKVSDGSIGDAEHATRDSDHNPWYGPGIVTARDYTNDPAGGLDCNWLAAVLIASGDRRIKYIIWNRRIWTPGTGWKSYSGINPHDHHLHLSVVASPACDDTTPWALGVEQDMDAAQNAALSEVWKTLVSDPTFYNKTNLAKQLGFVVTQVGEARTAANVASTVAQAIEGKLVELEAKVEAIQTGGVDAAQLATLLAPLIAKAVNDEFARRQAD